MSGFFILNIMSNETILKLLGAFIASIIVAIILVFKGLLKVFKMLFRLVKSNT